MEEQSESAFSFGEAVVTTEDIDSVTIGSVASIEVDRSELVDNFESECIETQTTYGDIYDSIEFSFTADIEEAQNQLQKWLSGGDWDREHLSVSELDDTHCCPNCDREFHQPSWKPLDGFNHYGSIQWEYGCPTETCDTLIVVKNDCVTIR